MAMAIALLVFLLLPLAWAGWLFFARWATRGDHHLNKALFGVYAALCAVIGPWWSWGYPLLALLLAVAAVALARRCRLAPEVSGALAARVGRNLVRVSNAAALLLLGSALIAAARGWVAPAHAYALAWPLTGGVYAVGQGGASELVNYHYPHDEQRFAIDLVKAPLFTIRLHPRARLADYPSFGTTVRAPCAGTVAETRDHLPDLVPPASDAKNAAGNFVAIQCDGGPRVYLAHLAQRSLEVQSGDGIEAGRAIGRLGNSGNTSEPHLHVHAIDPRTRAPRALVFADHFPARNQLAVID